MTMQLWPVPVFSIVLVLVIVLVLSSFSSARLGAPILRFFGPFVCDSSVARSKRRENENDYENENDEGGAMRERSREGPR